MKLNTSQELKSTLKPVTKKVSKTVIKLSRPEIQASGNFFEEMGQNFGKKVDQGIRKLEQEIQKGFARQDRLYQATVAARPEAWNSFSSDNKIFDQDNAVSNPGSNGGNEDVSNDGGGTDGGGNNDGGNNEEGSNEEGEQPTGAFEKLGAVAKKVLEKGETVNTYVETVVEKVPTSIKYGIETVYIPYLVGKEGGKSGAREYDVEKKKKADEEKKKADEEKKSEDSSENLESSESSENSSAGA